MNLGTYIINGFKQYLFDTQATKDIVASPDGFRNGVLLLALISGFYALITFGVMIVFGQVFGYHIRAFGALYAVAVFSLLFIGSFIFYGITHLIARLFGGKTSFKKLFAAGVAAMCAGALIGLGVTILGTLLFMGWPILLALGIYAVVIFVLIVREVYQFSTGRAVATVLLPVAVVFTLVSILVIALVG